MVASYAISFLFEIVCRASRRKTSVINSKVRSMKLLRDAYEGVKSSSESDKWISHIF